MVSEKTPDEMQAISLETMHKVIAAGEKMIITYYAPERNRCLHFPHAIEQLQQVNAILEKHGIPLK